MSVSQAGVINLGDIKGYMTAKYNTACMVVRVCLENRLSIQGVPMTFLHPHGPCRLFHYNHAHHTF